MRKTKNIHTIQDFYKQLSSIYTLYKIEHESLYLCYEENRDFSHIFSLNTIISERFEKLLKDSNQTNLLT